MVERIDPGRTPPDERTIVSQYLDYHRATLLMKVEGLTEEQARYSPVRSGTSLLGLVRHLAECERWWFRRCAAGEDVDPIYSDEADPDRDWHPGPDDTLAEAIATYQAECERSRQIVASAPSLDAVTPLASSGSEPTHPRRNQNLRWILAHMVEETARHNGHADIIREMIDGMTGT